MDFNILIGGPQGGGIDTAANLVGKAVATSGYGVLSVREYHSNIKGRHSYTHMRVKEDQPRSLKYPVNIFVALDPDTIFEHLDDVSEASIVIYDKTTEDYDLQAARMIMRDTSAKIRSILQENGFETTIRGALKYMQKRGAKLLPVPFADIATQAVPNGTPSRYFNTIGAAIALAIIGIDEKFAKDSISYIFRGKQQVVEENVKVVEQSYKFATDSGVAGKTLPAKPTPRKLLLTGNDASALGKLLGGLRFQTYYPITPASDESTTLEEHQNIKWLKNEAESLKKGGVVIVQTEDELSAINMAIGGALTGARSATATSGPGFSLMAEGLSFAGMDEVPLVVTFYERGGPSTGLPTRNGQSDLLFALNAGHGEYPRIVFSSGTVDECIYDAVKALNYAAKYQMPVIHLIDKNLANTLDLISKIDLDKVKIEKVELAKEGDDVKRYDLNTQNGVSPYAVMGRNIFWMTGDEHDELGHVTEDSDIRDRMMEKRFKKLETADKEIPVDEKAQLIGPEDADITFVTWGSQKGPILDVIEDLKQDDITANLLYLKMFSPFPTEFVKSILSKAHLVIDVESNFTAQAAQMIKLYTGIEIENKILKYNGRHMTEDEILNSAKNILNKKSLMVVLEDGS
ncbi:2-ketovalerate ferredoxin oxidoreductase [VOR] alpha subunit [Thermoplasma volcanium GSS1]|uniref:2-oxoglutarate synthase subunit KorA n=1 Tax=Thermoplasma volcanium (strain ATCC 51530 / DSM 4299 / JCM 9571 / NBRC 15438 / GSS1) TaxID=273116 RepID=Q97AF0_THEVO|nr:2-oxoacid:ferredoxin oxidoreductase subunit alpha [Thermoplasma volcanium]BAB60002.1 2-ketovalerate ferredoxin oxidoreductase [VOR] alpha subunit [Thermoplasma volcanium GSS1]